MENQEELFSDRRLKAMIIPLFLEQLLVILVGIADTLVISYAGEAAVFLTPFFMRFYALEPETKRLVFWLVLIHNVFNAAAFPFSGALSSGLRAAGDVKFTMYVSVASTVAGRLALSYLLGIVFDLGVIGLAMAMACDWSVRAVIFVWRQRSGIWKKFQVI